MLALLTRQPACVSASDPGTMRLHDVSEAIAAWASVRRGKVTPVIDRSYPLERAADAVRYLETRHARGKVVVTIC